VLRYWADLPVAEVADILGCSEGTVTSTASRAAVRLAESLAHNAPPATQTHGPQPGKGNI
jgi:RNA polymerase sigma-70 factor (ECF subfamily)